MGEQGSDDGMRRGAGYPLQTMARAWRSVPVRWQPGRVLKEDSCYVTGCYQCIRLRPLLTRALGMRGGGERQEDQGGSPCSDPGERRGGSDMSGSERSECDAAETAAVTC